MRVLLLGKLVRFLCKVQFNCSKMSLTSSITSYNCDATPYSCTQIKESRNSSHYTKFLCDQWPLTGLSPYHSHNLYNPFSHPYMAFSLRVNGTVATDQVRIPNDKVMLCGGGNCIPHNSTYSFKELQSPGTFRF